MNDEEAITRFVRAVELLASATAKQAEIAEQQLKLQETMVKTQAEMAKGSKALEAMLKQ